MPYKNYQDRLRRVDYQKSVPLRRVHLLDNLPLHSKSTPTHIRNRCILSGRGRAVLTKYKLSRQCFREKALSLPGMKKASW